MNKKFFILLFPLLSLSLLPSCLEDDIESEDIVVEDRGNDYRKTEREKYEGEEEEDNEDTDEEETGNTDENFAALKGVYTGDLFSPDPDDEPSHLDVTVGANEKNGKQYFDLALYDAVVTGLELGDLIFTDIPATHNEKEASWTFNLKGQAVSLMGGAIEANVDVDGSITEDGGLKFSVTIDQPVLTLNYEGTKK